MRSKIGLLLHYASVDSISAKIDLWGMFMPGSDADDLDLLALFLSKTGCVIFGEGDLNGDNYKRNLAVQVFCKFTPKEIFDFGDRWLRKWKSNSDAPWYKEWVDIINRRDGSELADILLSSSQERVRQRSSMPFSEMLDAEEVLRIKRNTREEY